MDFEKEFKSLADAEKFSMAIRSIIKEYGFCTVDDFCELAGIRPVVSYTRYPSFKYGWTTNVNIPIYNMIDENKYIVHLPQPKWLGNIATVSKKDEVDMVNHPSHYQSETGLEVIDVIEAFTFDLKGIEATDTGNILKYICRWKNKNGIQDLKKAQWYLNHLIKHLELLEEENKK